MTEAEKKVNFDALIAIVIDIEFLWAPILTLGLNLILVLAGSSFPISLGFFNLGERNTPNLAVNIIELLAVAYGWMLFSSIYRGLRFSYKILAAIAVFTGAGLLVLQTASYFCVYFLT